MARITPEQIEQINEVYAECGVKSKTAKIVGVSVASVNKYLQENYIRKVDRVKPIFDKTLGNSDAYIARLKQSSNKFEEFFFSTQLSEDEWKELAELQKEAF